MSGVDITAFIPPELARQIEDACDAIRAPGSHGAPAFGLPEMQVVALGSAVGEWARGLADGPGRDELVRTLNRYIHDQLNAAERDQ